MAEHRGDLDEAVGDVGASRRAEVGQQGEDVAELPAPRPRPEAVDNLLVEGDQAHRILLLDHQVAKRRRQTDAVFKLRQLLAIGVAHRAAQVHDQVAGHARLRLELLHVILVGLRVDQPIDVLGVVAGGVFAVFAELDGKAVERAGVQSVEESLDDELRTEIEPLDLADDLRLQVFLDGGHRRDWE